VAVAVRVGVAAGLAAVVGMTIGAAVAVGLPAGAVPVDPAVGLAAGVPVAATAVAVGAGVASEPPSPATVKARMNVTSTTTVSIPIISGPIGRSLHCTRDIAPPQQPSIRP
jgi:hypothetical protein